MLMICNGKPERQCQHLANVGEIMMISSGALFGFAFLIRFIRNGGRMRSDSGIGSPEDEGLPV